MHARARMRDEEEEEEEAAGVFTFALFEWLDGCIFQIRAFWVVVVVVVSLTLYITAAAAAAAARVGIWFDNGYMLT